MMAPIIEAVNRRPIDMFTVTAACSTSYIYLSIHKHNNKKKLKRKIKLTQSDDSLLMSSPVLFISKKAISCLITDANS
jgi:hypothetical protein